jgi:lysyl-tRNA synthetase class 1
MLSAGYIKRSQAQLKKEGWLPLSVICPQCKKIATTVASDFDGETVMVNCYKTTVDYAEGCGFEGRVSPFGGKAKLPWKVEWPAKWKVSGTWSRAPAKTTQQRVALATLLTISLKRCSTTSHRSISIRILLSGRTKDVLI